MLKPDHLLIVVSPIPASSEVTKRFRFLEILAKRIRRSLLVAVAIGITTPSIAFECPVGQIVFREELSRREFIPNRVAIRTKHCPEDNRTDENGRTDRQRGFICKVYSAFFIKGVFEGAEIYALDLLIYSSAPCCGWFSGSLKELDASNIGSWLSEKESRNHLLSVDEMDFRPDAALLTPEDGPLAGGLFKPVCVIKK